MRKAIARRLRRIAGRIDGSACRCGCGLRKVTIKPRTLTVAESHRWQATMRAAVEDARRTGARLR